MRKSIILLSLMALMAFYGTAAAQEASPRPMLREGVKELGVSGIIDLEGPSGGIDMDINGSYGWFLDPRLEVGGFASFSKRGDVLGPQGQAGDVLTYGFGAFADYHLFGNDWVGWATTVPYVGASLGLNFTDYDVGEDESGLAFTPRVGIKWFFAEHLAIDTNFYFAWASDDIYVNDGDLESYDFGFNLGLRAYFE